jgi:hypothetical protein
MPVLGAWSVEMHGALLTQTQCVNQLALKWQVDAGIQTSAFCYTGTASDDMVIWPGKKEKEPTSTVDQLPSGH